MKAIVVVCELICFVIGLAVHDTLDIGMGLFFLLASVFMEDR